MKQRFAICKDGVDSFYKSIRRNAVPFESSQGFLYYRIIPNFKTKILFQETKEGLDLYLDSIFLSKTIFLRLKKHNDTSVEYEIKVTDIYLAILALPLIVMIPGVLVWLLISLMNIDKNVFTEIVKTNDFKEFAYNYMFILIIIYALFPINKFIIKRKIMKILNSEIKF